MIKKDHRLGEKFVNSQGCEFKIVSYNNALDIKILFEDGTLLEKVTYSRILRGAVINKNHPSVFGVGYLGEGIYGSRLKGKTIKAYCTWQGMLQRCYCPKTQEKQTTYIGCTVDERWHNFQNFANWYYENWKPWADTSWQLDKDILKKGNKIYSPETCCFVPAEINKIFIKTSKRRGECLIGVTKIKEGRYICQMTNMFRKSSYSGTFKTELECFENYKIIKEAYIKEIAEKWKDQIDPRVYKVMYEYKINITD